MTFDDLHLIPTILESIKKEGYTQPTPIQEQSIPIVLRRQDMIGCAQTGTGKTLAFAAPILQILSENQQKEFGGRKIKALILTPTRELAIQIDDSFTAYGRLTRLRHTVIFGGVKQHRQTSALQSGMDILTATPGRLMDLMNQKYVDLSHIEIFVLDEADRMLDMGFINDVKKIIAKLPLRRQSLMFSATMPREIVSLANSFLTNPARVDITPEASTAETVRQGVYYVDRVKKRDLLIHVLQDRTIESALVFTRTKHGADKVARYLNEAGIKTEAIHGNKAQNARQRALSNFKSGETRVLVATDIAARGLDIDELSHVINYEIPNIPETYVHRIGRTGRAGLNGIALSFCDHAEREFLRDIHKLIRSEIPVVADHPFPMSATPPPREKPEFFQRQFTQRRPTQSRQTPATGTSTYRPKTAAKPSAATETWKYKPKKWYGPRNPTRKPGSRTDS